MVPTDELPVKQETGTGWGMSLFFSGMAITPVVIQGSYQSEGNKHRSWCPKPAFTSPGVSREGGDGVRMDPLSAWS